MKIILVSSALTLSVFCFLASGSAKAQEFFFPNAYSQPSEMVDGLHEGARLQSAGLIMGRRRKGLARKPRATALVKD